MLGLCGSIKMKRTLDVGCGGGRWSERLADKGAEVIGIDIGRQIIKNNTDISRGRCKFMVMSADDLGFADEVFDLAISVTVLQHMPYPTQMKAIEEISRIVKRNGKVLIVERVGRNALPYTFPNSEKEWTDKFESNGLTLLAKKRNFFSPLIDLGHALKCILRPKRELGLKLYEALPNEERLSLWDKIYDIVTRPLIWISYPLGYICFYLFPQRLAVAKHSSFLFEKKTGHTRDDA
jgi:SAM-dependent methyltransferase